MRPESRLAVGLVLPALLLVGALGVAPVAAVARQSLQARSPLRAEVQEVGLAHYARLLREPRFRAALARTAYFAGVSVGLELFLGLALALVLRRAVLGRPWVRAVVLVPWALPTVVAARNWQWLLQPDHGLVNHLLGLRVNWLGDPALALHTLILVDVWKTTPFAALLLLAGRESIPPELYRQAQVDGAGPWRTFLHVTLPLLRPALLVTALFRFVDAFRVFDVVFVLTGGGPANATETVSVYAYKTYFGALRWGYGAAVAFAVFLLGFFLALAYLRALGGLRLEETRG